RGWGGWAQAGYDFTPHLGAWLFYGSDQPDADRFRRDTGAPLLRQLNHNLDALVRFKAGRYALGAEYFGAVTRWSTGRAMADQYAADWGSSHGVDVTVDHIALADLGTRANAEVAGQHGHDLFQFLSPPGAFEPQVLDLGDLVREVERKHGPLLDLCKRSTYNPVTRKWFGFSDNYVPDPGDYLKSVWTDIGMPDGPMAWEDLVKGAPLIKSKHPEIQIPIGIGM